MSGILMASQYYKSGTPALGNWVNTTPLTSLTDGFSVTHFTKIGSTITGMCPGGASSSKACYTTNNGATWAATSGFTTVYGTGALSANNAANLCSVVVGGTIMFLGNRGGVQNVSFSSDGINWGSQYGIPTSKINSDARFWWNGSLFVAVGSQGNVSTATATPPTSGADWSALQAATKTLFGVGSIQGIAYGAGRWVAIGQGSVFGITSTDGLNWSSIPNFTSISNANGIVNYYRLTFQGNKFFAMANASNIVFYSTDGLNWAATNTSSVFPGQIHTIIWNPDRSEYALAGNDSYIGFSSDGITWTADTGLQTAWSSTTLEAYTIIWTGSNYIAGGQAGRIATKSPL